MRNDKGFTLVEMAIVLVIIALVSAGILLGRLLLRQSQINSVMKEEQAYNQAILQFKDKYGYLPGDFPHATDYWGAAGGSSLNNYKAGCYNSTTATSIATCNGDGDGRLYKYNSGNTTDSTERFLVWQHLSNAAMIAERYTGMQGTPLLYADHDIGVNCPKSRMEGVGWGVAYVGNIDATDINLYPDTYSHVFTAGGEENGTMTINKVWTAQEALAFDTKYDDGLPAYGSIRNWKSNVYGHCSTTDVSTTAVYDTSLMGPQCSFYFTSGF